MNLETVQFKQQMHTSVEPTQNCSSCQTTNLVNTPFTVCKMDGDYCHWEMQFEETKVCMHPVAVTVR